jgi:NTE family protein
VCETPILTGPSRWLRAVIAGLVALGCAACAAPLQRTVKPQAPPPSEERARGVSETGRSTVGVAFGGGSARGIAHVGVIRWMEEHRIPIDVAAGTSMGGLVGGAFASGMDAKELHSFITGLNWDQLFGASTFEHKNIRRKADARAYPSRLEFGLKGGLVPPTALNNGQYVELLLGRIAGPYFEIEDFDDLPTPFRTVAVDLLSAQPIVMRRGSFADAMRATMSLPLIFPPVEVDGQVLIDGGTMNNIPADVVKAMGADRVVAINVGDLSDREGVSYTMFGVAGNTLDAMMRASTRRAIAAADVVVTVPLSEYGSLDWRRAEGMIEEGYRAAEAMRDQLLPLAVSEADYEAWRARRLARRRTELPPPAFIQLEGFGDRDAKRLQLMLARHVGVPLNIQAVETDLATVGGLDRYETVTWRLTRDAAQGYGLRVVGRVKTYAPPFFMLGVNLENTTSSDFRITLTGRYLAFDVIGSGSELRFDGTLGSNPSLASELYRPIGSTALFVAPYAGVGTETFNFIVDDAVVARYGQTQARLGLNLGVNLGARSDLRLGAYVGRSRASIEVGDPGFPELEGQQTGAQLVWRLDTQDATVAPRRGILANVELSRLFTGPDITVDGETFDYEAELTQLSMVANKFWSRGPRNRVFVYGGLGTSFNHEPLPTNEFTLGSPFRLGAYSPGELRGSHYYALSGGLLHQVGRLPDFMGGPIFAGVWLDNADAFDDWDQAGWRSNGGIGLVMDTLVGPVMIAGSWGYDGRWRTYVGVGRTFRFR